MIIKNDRTFYSSCIFVTNKISNTVFVAMSEILKSIMLGTTSA